MVLTKNVLSKNPLKITASHSRIADEFKYGQTRKRKEDRCMEKYADLVISMKQWDSPWCLNCWWVVPSTRIKPRLVSVLTGNPHFLTHTAEEQPAKSRKGFKTCIQQAKTTRSACLQIASYHCYSPHPTTIQLPWYSFSLRFPHPPGLLPSSWMEVKHMLYVPSWSKGISPGMGARLSPGENADLQPWRQHPTGCSPAESTFPSWLYVEHRGWIRPSRGSCLPQQLRCSVKCLLEMSQHCYRTDRPPNVIQNCLLGYTGRKQGRRNTHFYQDLYLQVKLKPQAFHVTCQPPNNFPASPYSLSSVFIILHLFQLFCCCRRSIRLTASKTIPNFYQRNQGKTEILQKRLWQRLTHLPVLWRTKHRNNLLQA